MVFKLNGTVDVFAVYGKHIRKIREKEVETFKNDLMLLNTPKLRLGIIASLLMLFIITCTVTLICRFFYQESVSAIGVLIRVATILFSAAMFTSSYKLYTQCADSEVSVLDCDCSAIIDESTRDGDKLYAVVTAGDETSKILVTLRKLDIINDKDFKAKILLSPLSTNMVLVRDYTTEVKPN